MLIFLEGVPGSGKTYSAVLHHVLPALRDGRKVYARLNGLQAERIAEYLDVPADHVYKLLVDLDAVRVREVLTIDQQGEGEPVLHPELDRDALVIIDEAHEFYVSSRQPLPEPSERFFALHRHFGLDVVLCSQWYKRLHPAVRARVERKVCYQKLTALGLSNRYVARHMQSVAPDKFAEADKQTHKFRKEVFPLYQSVQGGERGLQAYKGDKRTVWRKLTMPIALMLGALVWGVTYLLGFFGGDVDVTGRGQTAAQATMQQPVGQRQPMAQSTTATVPAVPIISEPKLNAGQRYVWELVKGGRVRLAADYAGPKGRIGIVEVRDGQGVVLDSLNTRQLEAMGWAVHWRAYGVQLVAAKDARLIATAWPVEDPVREQDARLYRLDKPQQQERAVMTPPSVSEPAAFTAAHTRSIGQAYRSPESIPMPAISSTIGR